MENNNFYKLINNVKQEIKNEHWYWHVINLAWTAGPVTFIAVYAAYYVGYGQLTSIKTIIYFGLYTILAGLLAIIFQTFKNASINQKLTDFKYELNHVIDRMLVYIYFCKEEQILSLPENQRGMMAAWQVLNSTISDIEIIKHAVYLCTKQKKLEEAIGYIEFFRHQGFPNLLMDVYASVEDPLNKAIENIEPTFPSLAKTLQKRFKGITKTRAGKTPGFFIPFDYSGR